jgi:molybdopterin/thiamine biosynthesis adenylyltransferase
MDDDEMYTRQTSLELDVPERVTIIGLGGIGFWMAMGLAMAGTRELILVDSDVFEDHNRNRVPIHEYDVGNYKVDVASEHIRDLRPYCEVIPYNKHTDKLSKDALEKINETCIVDCRDNVKPIPNINKPILKAGYDGTKLTIHTHPNYDCIFGDINGGYRIIPSWVGTPMVVTGICLHYLCMSRSDEIERIVSFDVKDILDIITSYHAMSHEQNRKKES